MNKHTAARRRLFPTGSRVRMAASVRSLFSFPKTPHLRVDPLLGLGFELEHGRRAGEVAVRGHLDRVVGRRAVPVRRARLSSTATAEIGDLRGNGSGHRVGGGTATAVRSSVYFHLVPTKV